MYLWIEIVFLPLGKVQEGQRGSAQHIVLTASWDSGDSFCQADGGDSQRGEKLCVSLRPPEVVYEEKLALANIDGE